MQTKESYTYIQAYKGHQLTSAMQFLLQKIVLKYSIRKYIRVVQIFCFGDVKKEFKNFECPLMIQAKSNYTHSFYFNVGRSMQNNDDELVSIFKHYKVLLILNKSTL